VVALTKSLGETPGAWLIAASYVATDEGRGG
jgi:hypothetical protein